MLSISFFGGTGSVTGACFLYASETKKFLIDCGLAQGGEYAEKKNYEPFAFDPKEIQVLIVTHAHADHIGRIPKLVRDGFRGIIYSTPATKDLAEVMFPDALSILGQEAQEHGHDPLYEKEDIAQAFSLWQTHDYHESFSIGDDITAHFKDAGHILGSAMVVLERNGKVFVHTGDLGNSPSPLLRDTEMVPNAHFILTESVYGDRVHEARDEREQRLKQALHDAYTNKKTLLIPTFAIERTQILLYIINNLVENGDVPVIPVFLDSPLASSVTNVYRSYTHLFNDAVQAEIKKGDDIFAFPQFVETVSHADSQQVSKTPAPKVILASSGMSVGGRVVSHEQVVLQDKNAVVLFVGYQGVGTLGRRIQEGNARVKIGENWIKVRATIQSISGFSGHKDRDDILAWIEPAVPTLKKVFVAMGETKASLFLTQRIRDFLGVDAVAPEEGDVMTVDF